MTYYEGLATSGLLKDAEINQNANDDNVNQNNVDHSDPVDFEPLISNKEVG